MHTRRCLLLATVALPLAVNSAWARDYAVTFRQLPSRRLGRPLPYLTYAAGPVGPSSPVLYLLHGHGGNEWSWVRAGRAIDTVNDMIEQRALPPLFLVLPGVGNSWYVDAPPPLAPMASALLQELVPAVEKILRLAPGPRALLGSSMGGWGALHLGLTEPARWSFIGAMSPAVFTPASPLSEAQIQLFAGAFGNPFERARLEAASPFSRLSKLAATRRRPAIHLSCGREDGFGFAEGTSTLHRAFAAAGITSTLHLPSGQHDWAFWRACLPQTLAAFAATLS